MIYCKDLCHNSFPLCTKEEKHPLLPSSSHGQCLVKCTWLFCLLPRPVQMTWRSIIVICEITGPQTVNASPHNTSWNFWSKFPIWGSFGLTESPPHARPMFIHSAPSAFQRRLLSFSSRSEECAHVFRQHFTKFHIRNQGLWREIEVYKSRKTEWT